MRQFKLDDHVYRGNLNEHVLLSFLREVDMLFPVPISQKVDLQLYAIKLCEHADILYYKDDKGIKGIVAGYIRESTGEFAYISILAVLPDAQGRGIGQKLVQMFVDIAKQQNKRGVHLYAVRSNIPAMTVYKKLNFHEVVFKNEARPNDVHFVYTMEENI